MAYSCHTLAASQSHWTGRSVDACFSCLLQQLSARLLISRSEMCCAISTRNPDVQVWYYVQECAFGTFWRSGCSGGAAVLAAGASTCRQSAEVQDVEVLV